MATNTQSSAAQSSASKSATPKSEEAVLEQRLSDLQKDVAAIAAALGDLGNKKVGEARSEVQKRYDDAMALGQTALSDVTGEARRYESELKSAIREKPLTAMAAAIGAGFLAAILFRR